MTKIIKADPTTGEQEVLSGPAATDPMDFLEALVAMDDRAKAQGHSLADVLQWAAHAGFGISLAPLPIEEA